MTRQALVLATVLFVAAASVLGAPRWSDWISKDGDVLSGSFVPWADSREQDFIRQLRGYASLHYSISPFVGELILSPGPGTDGDGATLKETVLLVVETVVLPEGRAGAPSVANDAHYALNPFLAFVTPPGEAGETVFTFSSFFPAGSPLPLRAPVFAASVSLSTKIRNAGDYGDSLLRVRWKALDKSGATVASGIIPDAFSTRSGFAGKSVELFAWRGEKGSSSRGSDTALATDASFHAWPMLARGVKSLSLGAGIIGRVFGNDSKAFAAFLRRARLVGVEVAFDEVAAQSPVVKSAVAEIARESVIIGLDSESHRWTHSLSGEAPCTQPCQYSDSPAFEAHKPQDEEMIAPARMPGDTLGRDTGAYAAATSLFMLLFAVGTAALLIRFFAKRRGEARLAVWTALPAWCAAASAVVFLAVRPLLDRAPRADVTEWRFAIAGEPEELRVECGRAHSFSRTPAAWTMAPDGWFAEEAICEGASIIRGIPAGRMTLSGRPLVRGELEKVVAMRFAPHVERPLSITADPDAHPATPREFSMLLKGWLGSLDVETPLREITAAADFAGVWVFTRGLWYGLGPMKKGETRKLDASMRIWQGADLTRKAYTTLFMKSPFSVRDGRADITKKAEAWLAAAKDDGDPPIDAGLAGDICSAVVFALREGEDEKPDFAPSFERSRRPVITSRIVNVEVFQ